MQQTKNSPELLKVIFYFDNTFSLYSLQHSKMYEAADTFQHQLPLGTLYIKASVHPPAIRTQRQKTFSGDRMSCFPVSNFPCSSCFYNVFLPKVHNGAGILFFQNNEICALHNARNIIEMNNQVIKQLQLERTVLQFQSNNKWCMEEFPQIIVNKHPKALRHERDNEITICKCTQGTEKNRDQR